MSEELARLYHVHATEQSKYVYFLLGATGAALGFALQKLDDSTYNSYVWLGLLAITSWLLSFLFGCRHITALQNARYCNYELIRAKEKRDGYAIKVIEAAHAGIESNNRRADSSSHWQFRLLAFGVVCFTAWRVVLLFFPHSSAS